MGSWVEQIDAIGPRAALTERARARIAAMVNVEGWSIAAAAWEFGRMSGFPLNFGADLIFIFA